MIEIWNNFFYEPLYNALIFLIGVVPYGDAGLAVVSLTVVVKLVLYPLSQKSIKAQAKMRSLEGELSSIRDKHKDDKQEQAKKTMDLYKKHNVNPFSGCLTLLIQLPIILALYFVFYKGLSPDGAYLYSFIHFPENINEHLLGIFNLGEKSIILALLAGISQYIQMDFSLPKLSKDDKPVKTFAEELSRSMNTQMRYILPIMVIFIGYTTSAAVSLYWITSSIFSIGQEILAKKTN